MFFAEDSTGFLLLKLSPDCSGPKIKTSLFYDYSLITDEIFSCSCTNTLTCPASAEFTVTSSRIWWTCKKCDTVWSFITVLKKYTLREIQIQLPDRNPSPLFALKVFCSAAPAAPAASEFHLNTKSLSRNQLCPGLFLGRTCTWSSARAGTTQTFLSMHLSPWCPICCEGVLLPVKLSGLILQWLFFSFLGGKIHTGHGVESFRFLWSRLADPGTYVQGCLNKGRAV